MCVLHSRNSKIDFDKIAEKFYKISTIEIKNKKLLIKSLSHKSFSEEINYERLEFLGDNVLALLTAEYLYKHNKESNEGELSNLKTMIVNRESLSYVFDKLNLIDITFYDKKSFKTDIPDSIKEDIIESTLAVVYIDRGIGSARKYFKIILKYAGEISKHFFAKNKLQEFTVKHYKAFPQFKTFEKDGKFYCELYINDKYIASENALSKKECEKKVALKVYNKLKKELKCG